MPVRDGTWHSWLAPLGLGLMAVEGILIGLALGALGSGILGGSSSVVWSAVWPMLGIGAILVAAAIQLVRGSRAAWLAALVAAVLPIGAWLVAAVSGEDAALDVLTILFIVPPMLVVIGLGLGWRRFWQPPPG